MTFADWLIKFKNPIHDQPRITSRIITKVIFQDINHGNRRPKSHLHQSSSSWVWHFHPFGGHISGCSTRVEKTMPGHWSPKLPVVCRSGVWWWGCLSWESVVSNLPKLLVIGRIISPKYPKYPKYGRKSRCFLKPPIRSCWFSMRLDHVGGFWWDVFGRTWFSRCWFYTFTVHCG